MTNDLPHCPWCSAPLELVWVHGHGQCARCGINVDECCRGECVAPATTPAAPSSTQEKSGDVVGQKGEEESKAR